MPGSSWAGGHHVWDSGVCHARGCGARTRGPSALMCSRHWRLVPAHLRFRVSREYMPSLKHPGLGPRRWVPRAWARAARAAIRAVSLAEARAQCGAP